MLEEVEEQYEEIEKELLTEAEARRKRKTRTRGPYRKASPLPKKSSRGK